MASPTDFLSANKNLVIATNGLNQVLLNVQRRAYGDKTSLCLTAKTLVASGSGFLVSVSVVEGGTKAGFAHDAGSLASVNDEGRMMALPETAGVYSAGFAFDDGLVIVPGEGQAVTVTYSMD